MREQLSPQNFLKSFYGRRMLRIFPLYYFYLVIVFLICFAGLKHYGWIDEISGFIKQAPWAFSYTYDFFHASAFYKVPNSFVTHFWSLAVEEQFYLICPVVILLTRPNKLRKLLLITIFLGPVWRLAIAIIAQSGAFPFMGAPVDRVIYVLPFSHLDAFAMGGYFALYRISQKSGIPALLILFCAIPLGYITQYLAKQHIDLSSFGYTYYLRDQYIWGYSFFNYAFANALTQIKDDHFVPWIFNNPVLHYLGKISYGLYVFHYPIIWLVKSINPSWPKISIALLSLAITICVSFLSYELFEKIFLNAKDRFFPKQQEHKLTPVMPLRS